MPRSYSFDHYQLPQSREVSRGLHKRDKQKVKGDEPAAPEREIAYGKAHAKTEELYQAKEKAYPARAQANARAARSEAELAQKLSHHVPERVRSPGAPIGALPATPELPPEGHLLGELAAHAVRTQRVLRLAVQDATRAALRLMTLPLHAALLVGRRLQRA